MLLVWLLRLAGVITASAFVAMLMPVEWMAATHRWLGLGELPRAAVVEYLARSIAALYGFQGLLLLLVSTSPVRYRTIIWFVAFMNIAFGLIVLGIDLHAGMPAFWTIGEGPPVVALGIVIAMLNRSTPAARPQQEQAGHMTITDRDVRMIVVAFEDAVTWCETLCEETERLVASAKARRPPDPGELETIAARLEETRRQLRANQDEVRRIKARVGIV